MRKVGAGILSVCVGFIPLSAWAQVLSSDESATLPRIIDHACLELTDDYNGCENVILLHNGDSADLVILSDLRTQDNDTTIMIARNFVWAGSIWGQWPSISQADNGSLVITAENFGVGRDAWTRNLTLAWRGEEFVVAGFTYSVVDRAMAFTSICDVNLLSGGWETRIGTYLDRENSGTMAKQWISASEWTFDQPTPAPCMENLDQFYADIALCEGSDAPDSCTPE